MNNNLSKEQLLLLQHNLTYEVYEKFMSLFPKDEKLPEEKSERINYILDTMKEHVFWGEIKGWGDKRVYKNIPFNCDIFFTIYNYLLSEYTYIVGSPKHDCS